uniref:Uncharacterized protein n=1 Tax=Anguilla anguilla TaxID=7936 RepID=A0A0E9XBH4_ANGAN
MHITVINSNIINLLWILAFSLLVNAKRKVRRASKEPNGPISN